MPRPVLLAWFCLSTGCGPGGQRPDTGTRDPGGSVPCQGWSYPDRDHDGFGAEEGALPVCPPLPGFSTRAGDCDDLDPEVHPGGKERCNGADDDCDGQLDEGHDLGIWYLDADGDGWGIEAVPIEACALPEGYAAQAGDCDDADGASFPGARELCDDADQDCDGEVDEGCGGTCGDGVKGGAHEACDGDDDVACPGRCSRHCACPSAEPGDMRVHMIDVWQGDAFLVISPDGFTLLVDAGPSSEREHLLATLAELSPRGLDYTLVSHQHSDHNASLDDALREHPEVVACFDNGGTFDSSYDRDYLTAAGERRVPVVPGDTLDLGPAMAVEVLHSDVGADNENENSVVVRLTFGGFSMLMGGDCEAPCEAQLDLDPVDVYKVHHHGSDDSSSEPFLDQIGPRVALIPVGEGNSYGHPHYSTLRHLEDRGVDVYRTDEDGDVALVSDGDGFDVAGEEYP